MMAKAWMLLTHVLCVNYELWLFIYRPNAYILLNLIKHILQMYRKKQTKTKNKQTQQQQLLQFFKRLKMSSCKLNASFADDNITLEENRDSLSVNFD